MTTEVMAARTDRLKALVHTILSPHIDKDFDVNVETFGEGDAIRVAEVGYWVTGKVAGTGGGAAWMRCDIECAPVILACEKFLLSCDQPIRVFEGYVDGKYDPTILDEAQEVELDVWAALKGDEQEMPKWQIRWPADDVVTYDTEWYDAEKHAAYLAARDTLETDSRAGDA